MHLNNKNYMVLVVWIVSLILIGSIIGSIIQPHSSGWYASLNRSAITPPSYIFGIIWTILYGLIGTCGWLIWQSSPSTTLTVIKILYVIQLILNWSWTPLFFYYHLTGTSLVVVLIMNIAISIIIYKAYENITAVSLLMIPYFLWLLLATYLNFYIWYYN